MRISEVVAFVRALDDHRSNVKGRWDTLIPQTAVKVCQTWGLVRSYDAVADIAGLDAPSAEVPVAAPPPEPPEEVF